MLLLPTNIPRPSLHIRRADAEPPIPILPRKSRPHERIVYPMRRIPFQPRHKFLIRHRLRFPNQQMNMIHRPIHLNNPPIHTSHNPAHIFKQTPLHISGNRPLPVLRGKNNVPIFAMERLRHNPQNLPSNPIPTQSIPCVPGLSPPPKLSNLPSSHVTHQMPKPRLTSSAFPPTPRSIKTQYPRAHTAPPPAP